MSIDYANMFQAFTKSNYKMVIIKLPVASLFY